MKILLINGTSPRVLIERIIPRRSPSPPLTNSPHHHTKRRHSARSSMQTSTTVKRRRMAREPSPLPLAPPASPSPVALNTTIPLNVDEGTFYAELDEHLKKLHKKN